MSARSETYSAIHQRLSGSPLAEDFAEMQRALEQSEERYNGWTNYPTWNVSLWLSNDAGLYEEAIDRTRDLLELDHPTSEYWTVEESRRFNVADMLKDWVRNELAPDLGASFAADLLGYALDDVDWHEIADAWIEQVDDA